MIFSYQIERSIKRIDDNFKIENIPKILSDEKALILILKTILQIDKKRIIIWKSFVVNEIDKFSKINIAIIIITIILLSISIGLIIIFSHYPLKNHLNSSLKNDI